MTIRNTLLLAASGCAFATAAAAGNYDNSVNYNNPIGMTSGQENSTVNSSLRDANGNLTVVNGQITSSSFSEVHGAQSFAGGVGNPAGTMNGTATAIGNSAQRGHCRLEQHRDRQLDPDQQRQSDRQHQPERQLILSKAEGSPIP